MRETMSFLCDEESGMLWVLRAWSKLEECIF